MVFGQEQADSLKRLLASFPLKETCIAHAMHVAWNDMEQEPANELFSLHGLLDRFVHSIIPLPNGNMRPIVLDDPVIGDRRSLDIVRKIAGAAQLRLQFIRSDLCIGFPAPLR